MKSARMERSFFLSSHFSLPQELIDDHISSSDQRVVSPMKDAVDFIQH